MITIFTFGLKVTHRGENRLEALKQFIQQYAITTVLDVRFNTGNHYPHWNCNGDHIETMIKSVFNGSVRYIHDFRMGMPPEKRQEYKYKPNWGEFWYQFHVQSNKALEFFENCAESERIVLLCVENLKNPETPYCHRIWLRNFLVEMNIAQLGEIVEEPGQY